MSERTDGRTNERPSRIERNSLYRRDSVLLSSSFEIRVTLSRNSIVTISLADIPGYFRPTRFRRCFAAMRAARVRARDRNSRRKKTGTVRVRAKRVKEIGLGTGAKRDATRRDRHVSPPRIRPTCEAQRSQGEGKKAPGDRRRAR